VMRAEEFEFRVSDEELAEAEKALQIKARY
jgi:hypothetical protein